MLASAFEEVFKLTMVVLVATAFGESSSGVEVSAIRLLEVFVRHSTFSGLVFLCCSVLADSSSRWTTSGP